MEAKRVIITRDEARKLVGKEYAKGLFFNPFLDEDMNICITEQEISQITIEDFIYLKDKIPVDKSEILKTFKTEKEWLEYYKTEAQKELADLDVKIKREPKI